MSRWLSHGRVGIAALLAATVMTLSLCPSECLATTDIRSTAASSDCHDSAPTETNHAAGHDLACCDLSVAVGVWSGSEAAAVEPPPGPFAPLPVKPLAVHLLGARSQSFGCARYGPEPFRARSPILLI